MRSCVHRCFKRCLNCQAPRTGIGGGGELTGDGGSGGLGGLGGDGGDGGSGGAAMTAAALSDVLAVTFRTCPESTEYTPERGECIGAFVRTCFTTAVAAGAVVSSRGDERRTYASACIAPEQHQCFFRPTERPVALQREQGQMGTSAHLETWHSGARVDSHLRGRHAQRACAHSQQRSSLRLEAARTDCLGLRTVSATRKSTVDNGPAHENGTPAPWASADIPAALAATSSAREDAGVADEFVSCERGGDAWHEA